MTEAEKVHSEWQTWRFDQIAENVGERADPTPEDSELYVGLEHMDTDSLTIRRWGSKTDLIGQKLRMRKGDILFARRNAYLKRVAIAPHEGLFSAHGMVLRPKPEVVSPDFLPFFMQSGVFMSRAIEISVGSLSPTINWKTLASQEFLLPPVEEQRRISKLMVAIDNMVESLNALVTQSEITVNSVREYVFQPIKTKRRSLNSLIVEIEAGKSLVGVNEAPVEEGETGVLKVSAVGKWVFLGSESKTLINQEQFISAHSVRKNDVLISRANTPDLVGLVCLVDKDYPNLMLSDKTLRLVPQKKISPLLLTESLKTVASRIFLKANATGTGGAMKNISQAKLRAMPIQFSFEENQAEDESVLKDALKAREKTVNHLAKLRELRNQMLRKVMESEKQYVQ